MDYIFVYNRAPDSRQKCNCRARLRITATRQIRTFFKNGKLLSFVANIFSYSNLKGIGQIARALGINVNHRQVRNVLLSPCSAVLASYSMHANRIMAEICLSI